MSRQRLAVVGGGTMGRGIAYAGLLAGWEVSIHEVSGELASVAARSVSDLIAAGIARGKLTDEQAAEAPTRLSTMVGLEGAGLAEIIIEAVPEDLALKVEIFRRLAQVRQSDAILATNTSALSITEIAASTGAPDHVCGMHFFNPVPAMRLVEVIRGMETSDETIRRASALVLAMGKTPVVLNESPGFVASRVNALIGNEAFRMLEEGVAVADDIDTALKLGLNHPQGPFELVDVVGLDVRLAVLNYLHETLGERFRPSPLLVRYVRAGRLGRKVGRGVYEYEGPGGPRRGRQA